MVDGLPGRMDWDARFEQAYATLGAAHQQQKSKFPSRWGSVTNGLPYLPTHATSKVAQHRHGRGCSGAALHGWTKDPLNHLTAPPSLREGVAPLYTVVLPGTKMRNGEAPGTAALQVRQEEVMK